MNDLPREKPALRTTRDYSLFVNTAENHPNNWTEYDMLCAGSAIDAALAKANGGAL